MDWLIGLLLLVVGGIIGFFVTKFVNINGKNTSASADNEQTIQELMTQQASLHVQESKQIIGNVITQAEALKSQIENYEQQLINQQTGPEGSSLSYFGEHAGTYLRNKSTTPVREQTNADVQPLDFSSQSSGLFSGNEETTTKEFKE